MLSQAESAVREAGKRGGLWTTAQEALRMAKTAYAMQDFEGAIRQARIAIEQAQLGMAQQGYPPLRF